MFLRSKSVWEQLRKESIPKSRGNEPTQLPVPNKEKAQEKTRRWRENHPEWEKEYRRKRAEKRRAQLIAEGKLKPKPPKMPLSVNNILSYFKTPESRASVLWLLQHKKKRKQKQ